MISWKENVTNQKVLTRIRRINEERSIVRVIRKKKQLDWSHFAKELSTKVTN